MDEQEQGRKMPLTPAEKMRIRRQKLKDQGKYEDYKKVHKETAKRSREKKNANIKKLSKSAQNKLKKIQRENTKQRVAKCRRLKAEKKKATAEPGTPVYNSASALGKAAARVSRMLPKSPQKKTVVVRKLYDSLVPNGSSTENKSSTKSRSSALCELTVVTVGDFYQRDDISRQSPGIKDVTTVRKEDGAKEKIQIRHLYSSVLETYAMFCSEYPNSKIGKSKFAELRPKHVFLSNKLPHNVCLCKYHENFILAVNSFHKVIPNFPAYSREFPENILCEHATEECWLSRCQMCQDKLSHKFEELQKDDVDMPANITWHVWEDEGRLSKVIEEGTSQELADYIISSAPQFLEHCYVKRQQAKSYKTQREIAGSSNFDPSIALLQVDFSENFTCVAQDEIQSFHWVQPQVSLFTAALWHTGVLHPIVIVSDNLNHTKDTVLAYMDILLEEVLSTVKEVHVWSDGPSSQFKNRYVAASLPTLEKRHKKKVVWNYFATSHGKGPVDGIGGALKRQVRSSVMRRQHIVFNAFQFVRAASSMSTVKVIESSDADIESRNKDMNLAEVFDQAPCFPGISKIHFLRIKDEAPEVFFLSKDASQTSQSQSLSENADEVNIDDWFEVMYENTSYNGVVTEIGLNGDFKISVMKKCRKWWKWPEPKDEIFYTREQLLVKIQPPTIVNARGYYTFK